MLPREKSEQSMRFSPLPWQIEPWRDTSNVLLLDGGAGSGKSRLAAEKIHAAMLRYPGSTAIIGRKDRASASKSVVPMMLHAVMGDTTWGEYLKTQMIFHYHNDSRIYVAGMKDETQREALKSIRGKHGDPDFVWIEEANGISADDFVVLMTRKRGTRAGFSQLILTTNPDAPTHWINQDLIIPGNAARYFSRPVDNPLLPKAYIEYLKSLTGVAKDKYWFGKWVQAEGAIYKGFDTSKHLIDWFEIPDHWRRFRVVDFGFTAPFVCLWAALDEDNRIYIYRQIYMSRRTVTEHAARIKELSADEKIEYTICDHDAEDRATLEENGIPTISAKKEVTVGIEAVKNRFKIAEDGRPRLYILRGSLDVEDELMVRKKLPTKLEEELPAYAWADHKQKDMPIKENDHATDALRYLVMHVDKRHIGVWV